MDAKRQAEILRKCLGATPADGHMIREIHDALDAANKRLEAERIENAGLAEEYRKAADDRDRLRKEVERLKTLCDQAQASACVIDEDRMAMAGRIDDLKTPFKKLVSLARRYAEYMLDDEKGTVDEATKALEEEEW